MLIESILGQFPQDLYGDDLVAAMINRVNFTVNHFHQVNFLELKCKERIRSK